MEEKEEIDEDLTQPYSDQAESDLLPSFPTTYWGTQLFPPDKETQQDSAEAVSETETLVCTGSTNPVVTPGSKEDITGNEEGGWPKRIFTDEDMAILQLQAAKTYLPWFKDFNPFIIGYKPAGARVALFDCSRLGGVPVTSDKSRNHFLVDAFFRMRYYGAHQEFLHEQTKQVSPDSLSKLWNEFVESVEKEHVQWFNKLNQLEENFLTFNVEGMKIKIHLKSIEDCGRCCLREHYQCPMCYSDSSRASKETRRAMTPELYDMLIHFKTNWEADARVGKDQALLNRLNADTLTRQAESSWDRMWFDQRMRNTDSEVFKNYRMNLDLGRQLSAMKDHENNLRNFVRELKDEVDALKRTLKETGVSRRQRLE